MRTSPWLPVLIATCLAAAAQAQTIPFVLPWNDSSASVTDLSSLNSPIGTNSKVALDAAGHFAVHGQRVRFLGMNFAGDSPFMPTNKAEAVAARLAKIGINSVRFHHMDAPWASGGGLLAYTSTTSTNLNPAQLERVHFLVARLKSHGIYSDINLLVGREYRSADGLGPEIAQVTDWKDQHILGFFNDTALALQQDYATKLLTPTNRFTGLPLARDPAVAFVEIINENGIIQKWLDGGLDGLPATYASQLRTRWNTWLAARYPDDAALLTAWKAINQPLGPNLLRNGAFTNNLVNWNPEQHATAVASFTRTAEFTNGGPSARINVTQAGSQSWHVQLNQPGMSVTNGQPYTVSFWAKSSPATNFEASVMRAYGDYANAGCFMRRQLTTNWQWFTNTFLATVTDSNVRMNFGGMGLEVATFWIADVRLQPGGQLGQLPAGTSLSTRTVPNLAYSGSGFTGTAEARQDWLRFLRDLEYRYYDLMVTHLRSNIGYTGLVFGTIMANSPATVQTRLDVIDGHAYWQHPQFPGQPWDANNWTVPNISLVDTLGNDNTLAGLARQRVAGKPFVVTEYNHASPNYYGGEAPLLLGAYAALQDWDGVWFFDYGAGNDSVPMGQVRSYFDFAQHPTKLVNFLLAANLFRRGDVQPARQEITMALTPEKEISNLAGASAWGLFSSSQLGVPGKLAFTNRLSTSVGSGATGLTNPPSTPASDVITSDTGELKWDLNVAGQGIVTVNTPRTKAVIGHVTNRVFQLGELTLQAGSNRLGWCTIGATLTRGWTFTNDCTAVVVASGWWENTGQVWTGTNKNSVGTKWGTAPVLVEVVPFTLTLPVGTNRVSAWSLDPLGKRLNPLPITGGASSTTISVGTNAGSLWFEFEVTQSLAGFDRWRSQNFTNALQFADVQISGESAAPAGDRTANLLKYYYGLPAWPVPEPQQLPAGSLLESNGVPHLAYTFNRDPAASDVLCVPQVSSNLADWVSGPAAIAPVAITMVGPLERVTLLDLTPVAAQSSRFMRLQLTRH